MHRSRFQKEHLYVFLQDDLFISLAFFKIPEIFNNTFASLNDSSFVLTAFSVAYKELYLYANKSDSNRLDFIKLINTVNKLGKSVHPANALKNIVMQLKVTPGELADAGCYNDFLNRITSLNKENIIQEISKENIHFRGMFLKSFLSMNNLRIDQLFVGKLLDEGIDLLKDTEIYREDMAKAVTEFK